MVLHALWSCPAKFEVWATHFVWLVRQNRRSSNFLDVIQMCQERSDLFEIFAMTASLIWIRRNKLCVGEVAISLNKINSMAWDNLQEFQGLNPPPHYPTSPPKPVKWNLPPINRLKINFDGAVFKNEGLAGLGVIIQNDKGLVMATSSQTIPLPTSIEMVELLAARSAFCLARELQFDQVIVEGDSQLEIKKLNSKDQQTTPLPALDMSFGTSKLPFQPLEILFSLISADKETKQHIGLLDSLVIFPLFMSGWRVFLQLLFINLSWFNKTSLPPFSLVGRTLKKKKKTTLFNDPELL